MNVRISRGLAGDQTGVPRRNTRGVRVSLDTSGVAACTVARPRPDVHGAEGGILIREDGHRAACTAGRAHW